MAASDDYLKEVLRWHAWAREILGPSIHVVWKDQVLGYTGSLPDNAKMKTHPACTAVKRCNNNDKNACVHDCARRQDWWQRDGDTPFVFTCHAGLQEYRAPAVADGDLIGVWMIGPVRRPGSRRPHLIDPDAWAALATGFPPQTAAVAAMLGCHAASLAGLREGWILQRKASAARHPGIRRALRLIQQELSARLRAGDIAARVGLSQSQFSIAFKRTTGETFSDFVESRLMRRAAVALTDIDRPLRAIADRLGYTTPSYFTRAFKRYHGMTPSEYRERSLDPGEV